MIDHSQPPVNASPLSLRWYSPVEGFNSDWVHLTLLPPAKGAPLLEISNKVKNLATGKLAYIQGLREGIA